VEDTVQTLLYKQTPVQPAIVALDAKLNTLVE